MASYTRDDSSSSSSSSAAAADCTQEPTRESKKSATRKDKKRKHRSREESSSSSSSSAAAAEQRHDFARAHVKRHRLEDRLPLPVGKRQAASAQRERQGRCLGGRSVHHRERPALRAVGSLK